MDPAALPIARILFDEWVRNRGDQSGADWKRPFRRRWSTLQESASILTALELSEAEADLRELQKQGWITLHFVRYRRDCIDRIEIPLEQEVRWKLAFGFAPPDHAEIEAIQAHDWHPAMAFVREARLNIAYAELNALDKFIRERSGEEPLIPIKERSLQIFHDEKRLDGIAAGSALFGEGRLSLSHLACKIISEPLGWARGKKLLGPVIVLENLSTWWTYRKWDEVAPQFSAIVYGGGKRFMTGVSGMVDVFEEIGGVRTLYYFGDLDPMGLRIPWDASRRCQLQGWGGLFPHGVSYDLLLSIGVPQFIPPEDFMNARPEEIAWVGDCGEKVQKLFNTPARIPQEAVTLEVLRKCTVTS